MNLAPFVAQGYQQILGLMEQIGHTRLEMVFTFARDKLLEHASASASVSSSGDRDHPEANNTISPQLQSALIRHNCKLLCLNHKQRSTDSCYCNLLQLSYCSTAAPPADDSTLQGRCRHCYFRSVLARSTVSLYPLMLVRSSLRMHCNGYTGQIIDSSTASTQAEHHTNKIQPPCTAAYGRWPPICRKPL